MKRWVLQTLVACAAGLFAPTHGSELPKLPIAWIEMGPAGFIVARVVTTQSSCPSIALGAQPMSMQVRALPSPDFPIRICETMIPTGTKAATIEGQPLALPRTTPQRILVIGDTGCRMKAPSSFQACNDPNAWPFAKVAKSAATWKPDLVIHVGDFLYREAACPATMPGCAGSPWGDTWPAWDADFFTPAASLLQTAPWIVVRGNHESCSRAGKGWFLLLDPHPLPEFCRNVTEPYPVETGRQQFLVMDSAAIEETGAVAESQFAALRNMASPNAWLLTHRPLGQLDAVNAMPQTALDNRLPPTVQLVLSGHAHLFGVFTLPDNHLTQVVVGNSGAALHPDLAQALREQNRRDRTGARGKTLAEFGFVTIEQTAGSWTWTARDVNGAVMTTCRFDETATCTP